MNNLKKSAVMLIFILLIYPALGLYYADVKIEIDNDGAATISGETNHPSLVKYGTKEYTEYKDGRYLLNLTIPDIFGSYIYELDFPDGAKINYLKTPKLARINDEAGTIKVIGTGSNQPFVIIAQYSLHKKTDWVLVSLILFGIIGIGFISWNIIKHRKKTTAKGYNREALTERQKLIVGLIEKNKGSITQAKIEKITKLPRSSISRNIDSLVRRGIIKKEPKGMTNFIFFEKK